MNDRTEALLAETESRIAKDNDIKCVYDAYQYFDDLGCAIRNESILFIDSIEESVEAIYRLYQNHKNNERFKIAYNWYWQFDVEFFIGDELEEMAELYEKNRDIPAFEDYHKFLIKNGVYEYLD